MIREIIMPKLGETMEEGYISKWFKSEGDNVEKGEPLFEVMSDKTNFEVEATASGILRKIIAQPSDQAVQVTTLVGYLADSADEPLPAEGAQQPAAPVQTAETAPSPATSAQAQRAENSNAGGRVKASPLARKTAEELGIILSQVKGTGEGGRIEKKDVLAHRGKSAAGPDADYTVQPWTPLRRIIADKLSQSKKTIPHYYLSARILMDELSTIRQTKKARGENITYTDFIVWFCGRLLPEFPLLNATVVQDEIRVYNNVNIGLAVSVPDGLVVPVLRDIDNAGIGEIAGKVREAAGRAREGQLTKHEVENARFIVSNLGMYGVTKFSAIISPPATAILAVGAVEKEPVVKNGQVVAGETLWVTLSLDHRVVDGAYGGRFLQRLRTCMEHPATLLFP